MKFEFKRPIWSNGERCDTLAQAFDIVQKHNPELSRHPGYKVFSFQGLFKMISNEYERDVALNDYSEDMQDVFNERLARENSNYFVDIKWIDTNIYAFRPISAKKIGRERSNILTI
jgi:hypothetical protein